MQLTNHAKDRIHQRCGLPKASSERLAEKALSEGFTHKDTPGRLHRYMDSLYLKEKTANNIRVFNRSVFIFCEDILITVFPLPKEFWRVEDKLKRRRNESESE
jgi:hypothetical protein